MFETPSPTHGYLPVVAAFWVYVALAAGVALVTRANGLSVGLSFVVFLLAAVALLKPFLPLFRRLVPRAAHD